ncbi:hypothetical protein TcWFU_007959 [Taenia crassiceps]|uniref:Ig-like domain-containing protein n=1 Tax=Taenia crassiceps TaxID=6207 RepID=A0ABR4QF24_9CEST
MLPSGRPAFMPCCYRQALLLLPSEKWRGITSAVKIYNKLPRIYYLHKDLSRAFSHPIAHHRLAKAESSKQSFPAASFFAKGKEGPTTAAIVVVCALFGSSKPAGYVAALPLGGAVSMSAEHVLTKRIGSAFVNRASWDATVGQHWHRSGDTVRNDNRIDPRQRTNSKKFETRRKKLTKPVSPMLTRDAIQRFTGSTAAARILKFDCVELPRKYWMERNNYANPRLATTLLHEERPLANTSQRRFSSPCFNASFPTSLTVEEGSDVVLPCVVHNVDFNSIVMSWWKERAVRELAVGDNTSDKRFSIDKSIRGGWSLRIANVSISDSGVYICQINSKQLRERFISLSVSVHSQTKRPPVPTPSSNDVLVKDEAMHSGQNFDLTTQGSLWKPFLPALGYEWMQTKTTSAASYFPEFISLFLGFPVIHLLTVVI